MVKRPIIARHKTTLNSGVQSIEFGWGPRTNQQGFAYVKNGRIIGARLASVPCGMPDTWTSQRMMPETLVKAVLAAEKK